MSSSPDSHQAGDLSRPCPACGTRSTGVLLASQAPNDDGPLFRLARCPDCSLVFDHDWNDGFDDELYSYYEASLHRSLDDVYSTLTSDRLATILRALSRYVDGRRLLDVGCGAGQLVLVAFRLGWSARGIDLSRPAIAACRRSGLDCTVTDLLSDELDGERFDVITMIEFLEHVSTPVELVRRAEELLTPGGVLYLTTPNFDSLGRKVLGGKWEIVGPGHICYFTPRSLRRLILRSTTLRLETMKTKNLSIQAIRHLLRRRPAPQLDGLSVSGADRASPEEILAFRERIERSTGLRFAKRMTNEVLRLTRAGEPLEAVFRKPGEDHRNHLQAHESDGSALSA